jgi:hypothetical protein
MAHSLDGDGICSCTFRYRQLNHVLLHLLDSFSIGQAMPELRLPSLLPAAGPAATGVLPSCSDSDSEGVDGVSSESNGDRRPAAPPDGVVSLITDDENDAGGGAPRHT